MCNRVVTRVILCLCMGAFGVACTISAEAAPRPGAGKPAATVAKPSARKQSRRQKQRLNNLKGIIVRRRSEVRLLDRELAAVRRTENRIRQRHEASSSSRLRNDVRQATLKRANLELQRDAARQRYQQAQNQYRAARRELTVSRREGWKARLEKSGNRAREARQVRKAKKLSFASRPAGRSGSGDSRPAGRPKGILKKSSAYDRALAAKQAQGES